MEDSPDNWRYVIVVSKFILQFLSVAVAKSFGVLIPTMINVFSTDASSLGFVCSLPTSMMYLSCLPMAYILRSGRISPRWMAVIGALLSSLGIIIAGFLTSLTALGFCLALTGIGLSMGYLPAKVLLNDYFQDDYVLMNSISKLGSVVGALVVPVITERALQAYGFRGAMLILGGISLHAIVASATLRTMKSPRKSARIKKERKGTYENEEDIPLIHPNHDDQSVCDTAKVSGEMVISSDNQTASSKEISQYQGHQIFEDDVSSTNQTLSRCIRHCILIEEPLLSITLPCLFLMSFLIQSWPLFLVPRAMWLGIPSSEAVLLSSIGGGGGILGRFLSIALLYHRADFIVIYLILSVVSATTFLIDPLLTSFPVMCVTAFIQGLCVFTSGIAASAFLKSSVSGDNFTVAAGINGLVFGIGGNVGSLLSGMIRDKTGSYTAVFLALGFISCVNVLLIIGFLIARKRWK